MTLDIDDRDDRTDLVDRARGHRRRQDALGGAATFTHVEQRDMLATREHDQARAIRHGDDARLTDPDARVEPALPKVVEHDGRARRTDQLDQQRAAVENDRACTDARRHQVAWQRELELPEPDARTAALGRARRHKDPAIRCANAELLDRARAILALADHRAPLLALDQRSARATLHADDRHLADQLAERHRRTELRAVRREATQLARRDAPHLPGHDRRGHDVRGHVLGGDDGTIRKQRDKRRPRDRRRRQESRLGELHRQRHTRPRRKPCRGFGKAA